MGRITMVLKYNGYYYYYYYAAIIIPCKLVLSFLMDETKQFKYLKFNVQLKNQIQTAKRLLRSALTSVAGKVLERWLHLR